MTKSTKITIIAIVLIIILAIGFVIPTGNLFAAAADNKNIKIFFSWEYNNYTDSLYYYDRETGLEDKTKNLLDYPDYFAEKFIEYVTNNENQKLLYDMTQEVPAGLSGREYAMSKGDELAIAVINQFKYDQPMPNIAEMAEVWQPGSDMIVDIATGKENPENAAKKAQKEIKKTIKEKY